MPGVAFNLKPVGVREKPCLLVCSLSPLGPLPAAPPPSYVLLSVLFPSHVGEATSGGSGSRRLCGRCRSGKQR